MKLALSYFYQIRNFKKFMIPISTAVWDPKWFHDFKDKEHIFKDKNSVYNGIRFEELAPGDTCKDLCRGPEECSTKDSSKCLFLQNYRKQIQQLDKNKLLKECEILASNIQRKECFTEEPIIVFIVYETPNNKCSERNVLLEELNIEELKYPIKENY